MSRSEDDRVGSWKLINVLAVVGVEGRTYSRCWVLVVILQTVDRRAHSLRLSKDGERTSRYRSLTERLKNGSVTVYQFSFMPGV